MSAKSSERHVCAYLYCQAGAAACWRRAAGPLRPRTQRYLCPVSQYGSSPSPSSATDEVFRETVEGKHEEVTDYNTELCWRMCSACPHPWYRLERVVVQPQFFKAVNLFQNLRLTCRERITDQHMRHDGDMLPFLCRWCKFIFVFIVPLQRPTTGWTEP